MFRLVMNYSELGDLRFISHLELLSLMERAIRRAELPLRFSQGFNPHPKISFAYPLSVGVSSDDEVLDIELLEKLPPALVLDLLNKTLPPGIVLKNAKYSDTKDSLMSLVRFAEYRVSFSLSQVISQDDFNLAMASEAWIHQKINKKKKHIEQNIKPLIIFLNLSHDENRHTLTMKLHHSSESSVKPETVLKLLFKKLGIEEEPLRVRTHRLSLIGMQKFEEQPLFQCL